MAGRVIVYVDGFNLYYGMRDSKWKRYYWLDIRALATRLLLPGQSLVGVKYFTARVASPPSKVKRQGAYLEALDARAACEILYGRYQSSPEECRHCKKSYPRPREKMTDVRIATELLADAFEDRYDVAILVTADADLVPAIGRVRQLFPGKRLVAAFPPSRSSNDIRTVANAVTHIGRRMLAGCQLPDSVTKAGGVVLRRPGRWR